MNLINKKEIIVKKSKFIGYYYSIDNILEVKDILEYIKKEHKKARHIPYAYIINNNIKRSDDKEPSGTAGIPIYTVLEKKKLNNVLVIVVRYFGGIKLGAGGLFRAYMDITNEVVKEN